MNSTAHTVIPEVIMALLDGELSAAEAQAVSAHIVQCAECARLAEQFQATSRSLSCWTAPVPSLELDNSIREMAAKAVSGRMAAPPNHRARAGGWNWKAWTIASGGAVAALLLLFAISLPVLHRFDQADQAATQAKTARTENLSAFEKGSQGTGREPGGAFGAVAGSAPSPAPHRQRPRCKRPRCKRRQGRGVQAHLP